jgi:mRNA interferase MazF
MIAPSRGEIWMINFSPSIGAEIQKLRPAAIISVPSVGRLPLRMVVPITDWKPSYKDFPWFVRIPVSSLNNLSKESGADTFQTKSMSLNRFVRQLGQLLPDELADIILAVKVCIGGL